MTRGAGFFVLALLALSLHSVHCRRKALPPLGDTLGALQKLLPEAFKHIGTLNEEFIKNNVNRDEEAAAQPEKLAKAQGITLERYKITSGLYTIDIFEIPRSPSCGDKKCTPIILLAEGNCMGSEWILGDKSNSLGYNIADSCSPGVLGAHRGSVFGDRADKNRRTAEYWHHGWDEEAEDFGALLNNTLKKYNTDQVIVVAFSHGASAFLIHQATHPEDNPKIKAAVLISPMTIWKNCEVLKGVPLIVHQAGVAGVALYEGLNVPVIANSGQITSLFVPLNFGDFGYDVASGAAQITGGKPEDFNKVLTDGYRVCTKSGISLRSTAQVPYFYTQGGQFVGWGKTVPYDLSKITTKCYIFYSTSDKLVSPIDLKEATGKMPNVEYREINRPNFGHFNFVIDNAIGDILNKPVLEILAKECVCSG